MPKVSKHRVLILGNSITLDIHYNATSRFHVTKIDPEISTVTGISMRGYDTEQKITDALDKAAFEYNRIKTTKRKVIVYTIAATSSITMHPSGKHKGNFEGTKDWAKGKNISGIRWSGYAFGLDYDVLYRVDGRETKYYRMDTENVPPGWHDDPQLGREKDVPHDAIEIDWTPDREKAIQDICNGLEKLAMKAITILHDPKKTIQLLESSTKLIS